MAKIVSRWDASKVLFEADGDLRKTVMEAVAKKSDLRGSDLSGSNLRGSDLSGSNLRGSNLRGSDLRWSDLSGSNLSGSNLSGSDLRGSDLSGSDLRGSDLSGSDLSGSNLRGSDLRGSDLSGSDLSWQSHDLIAEILRRAAGDDVEKRKFAGLVLISRDWCWREFTALDDPMLPWALTELAKWIQPDDEHPEVLDAYVTATTVED